MKEDISYQLVPPDIYWRNAAEKDIATFKYHFIASLAGVHPEMPMHLWCRLIPLSIMTLNMMIQSIMKPKLSANAHFEGTHNFNTIPLAPAGTNVLIHKKSRKRLTWSPRGIDGWYIGQAPENYICYKVDAAKKRGWKYIIYNRILPTWYSNATILD